MSHVGMLRLSSAVALRRGCAAHLSYRSARPGRCLLRRRVLPQCGTDLMLCSSLRTRERSAPQCFPTARSTALPLRRARQAQRRAKQTRKADAQSRRAKHAHDSAQPRAGVAGGRTRRLALSGLSTEHTRGTRMRTHAQHARNRARARTESNKTRRSRTYAPRAAPRTRIDGRMADALAAVQVELLQRCSTFLKQRHHPCMMQLAQP